MGLTFANLATLGITNLATTVCKTAVTVPMDNQWPILNARLTTPTFAVLVTTVTI